MKAITDNQVIEALAQLKSDIQNGEKANNITVELLEGIKEGEGQEIFDALLNKYGLLSYDEVEDIYTLNLSKDIVYEIQLQNLLTDIEDGADVEEGFSYTQLLHTLGYDNVTNLDSDGALLSQLVASINKAGQYNAIVGGFARVGALLQVLKDRVEAE